MIKFYIVVDNLTIYQVQPVQQVSSAEAQKGK
jgi:hypothetical protein